MRKKHIDDLKIDFVMSVYESIQAQIRHADLKVSLILSWDSITVIMLGREIASMVAGRAVTPLHVILAGISLACVVASGVYIFGTLKPRVRSFADPSFKGLLYTGDILRLGKNAPERMTEYLSNLTAISENAEIYSQFIGSIVSVSEIVHIKNRMFLRALAATAIGFASLAGMIALVGARVALVK